MVIWSAVTSAQSVGDAVINPLTGGSETVVSELDNGGVLTDAENVIFLNTPALDSTFDDNGVTYQAVELLDC